VLPIFCKKTINKDIIDITKYIKDGVHKSFNFLGNAIILNGKKKLKN
jgi:hypothetical protein